MKQITDDEWEDWWIELLDSSDEDLLTVCRQSGLGNTDPSALREKIRSHLTRHSQDEVAN